MPTRHIITGQKIDPAKLQQAKALRRNMTPAEKRLWSALRANRLDGFHFRRQQIIDGFIVDFYCHAARLVVEVDGPVHDGQVEYDVERSRVLAARELQVLRVNNEEVMQNLEGILTRIRAACHTGADLTPRPPSLPGKGEAPLPRRGRVGGGKTPLPTSGKGWRREDSPPRIGEGPGEGAEIGGGKTPLPASGRGRGRGQRSGEESPPLPTSERGQERGQRSGEESSPPHVGERPGEGSEIGGGKPPSPTRGGARGGVP